MNPDLQKQLLDMLKGLTTAVQTGATFAASQIPPLVQEKILLGRVEETITFIGSLFLLGILIKVAFYAFNRQEAECRGDGWGFVAFFATLGSVVVTIITLFGMHSLLLVWFAPRLYIVEWLRELVK